MQGDQHISPGYWAEQNSFGPEQDANLKRLIESFKLEATEDKLYHKKASTLAARELLLRLSAEPSAAALTAMEGLYRLNRVRKQPAEFIAAFEARAWIRQHDDVAALGVQFRYAQSLLQAGRADEATAEFERLHNRLSPRQRAEWAKLQQRRANKPAAASRVFTGERFAAQLARDDFGAAASLLQAHWDAIAPGVSSAECAAVAHAAAAACARAAQLTSVLQGYNPAQPHADVTAPRRLLFVGGFGWSGSGAVADHLAQYDGVSLASGPDELIWLQGRRGMASIYDCVVGAYDAATVRSFVVCGLLGLPPPDPKAAGSTPDEYYARNGLVSRALREGVAPATATGWALAFLQRLAQVQDWPQYTTAFTALLEDWAASCRGNHPYLLVNNGLMAQRFALGRYLPPAHFVYVHRNPFDTYCSRSLEAPASDAYRQPQAFASFYLGNLKRFETALARHTALHGREHVLEVDFELVVTREAERARITAALGPALGRFDPQRGFPGRGFDPARSAHNVGIARSFHDQASLELLRSELQRQGYTPRASIAGLG